MIYNALFIISNDSDFIADNKRSLQASSALNIYYKPNSIDAI